MLNKLPDCDVPAEDDIWVNILFIQAKGGKQETEILLRFQKHPKTTPKPDLCCTSFVPMAADWELVPGLRVEEPSETVGFPALSDQTNPQQGLHNHLFWDTSLGWKTAILYGRVINAFGTILFHKLSLDIEASQGWDLFAHKCNSKVLQQFFQHVNPLSLFM